MPKHETNTDHSSNVINTGDHTIVLPSTDIKKNEPATHNNASQSSNEKILILESNKVNLANV